MAKRNSAHLNNVGKGVLSSPRRCPIKTLYRMLPLLSGDCPEKQHQGSEEEGFRGDTRRDPSAGRVSVGDSFSRS
jgi:hypothetical protein